jgi:hypothetical protein
MDDLQSKLSAMLGDPETMAQLQTMARSLGLDSPPAQKQEALPELDPAILQKLSGIARQSGTDRNQKALLSALGPYLSRDRIAKLERAMQAAKMARMASGFLGQGGLSLLTGR